MTGIKTSIHPQRPCQYTKYSLRPFRRLAAFLPRQNCFAPDSDGFSSDFWLLRRRCVVTPRNQIKAQQSGFDLKRKKERAKCSFRRKAETKWRKFLLTMRKGQKAPERRTVRRVCSCQPRVTYGVPDVNQLTTVPSFSPQSTRPIFSGSASAKTTTGMSLSMARLVAVESITARWRESTSS